MLSDAARRVGFKQALGKEKTCPARTKDNNLARGRLVVAERSPCLGNFFGRDKKVYLVMLLYLLVRMRHKAVTGADYAYDAEVQIGSNRTYRGGPTLALKENRP